MNDLSEAKRVDSLPEALNEMAEQFPHQAMVALLEQKLKTQRIKLTKREVHTLATRILKEKTGTVTLKRRKGLPDRNITIELTEEDFGRVERSLQGFLDDTLPDLVKDFIWQSSADVLAGLKKKWRHEARLQRRDLDGFRKRLAARWGAGLEGLRMLVTISRETGAKINNELATTKDLKSPRTAPVLIRLHARACQITEEIISLLANGFADGAMARWRTLHEIAAVCLLLDEHGDALTDRYVEHYIIETRKAALQFQKYCSRMGQRRIPPKEFASIEAQYAAALAKYGKEFANQYGWAAKHLMKANPNITEIQEASKVDHLAPYYRLASHNVHANPKGVFFKLGMIGERETLLAGPSNAGLADPGQHAAISLVQISSVLLQLTPSFDHTVAMKVMSDLSDEIGKELLEAHAKLAADEKNYSEMEIQQELRALQGLGPRATKPTRVKQGRRAPPTRRRKSRK
jgi:hypothetical protein